MTIFEPNHFILLEVGAVLYHDTPVVTDIRKITDVNNWNKKK